MIRFSPFVMAAALVACGPEEGDEGTVNLVFEDETDSSLYLGETVTNLLPDVFKMKFYDIRLGTVENNGGATDVITSIWAQKGCESSATEQEIDGKMYEVHNADYCTESDDADWIDLTSSSEEINAIFNNAMLPVPPASYNYLGISTCKMLSPKEGYVNYEFKAGDMPEALSGSQCQASWIKSENPIVVAEGQEVSVAVKFDLMTLVEQTVFDSDVNFSNEICWGSDDNLTWVCPELGANTFTVDLDVQ